MLKKHQLRQVNELQKSLLSQIKLQEYHSKISFPSYVS